jgi:hypothetical protein
MAKIKAVGSDTRSAAANRMAFALALCAVGTASVLRDAWPRAIHWPLIDLHIAFGVLLCLMVLAQFHAPIYGRLPGAAQACTHSAADLRGWYS